MLASLDLPYAFCGDQARFIWRSVKSIVPFACVEDEVVIMRSATLGEAIQEQMG